MGFKNFLREYFTFNRRQRNGVFVLLLIILALILYLSFADRFFQGEKTDFSKFDADIARFETQQAVIGDSAAKETRNNFSSSNTPAADAEERFTFNPNNLSVEDWKRLGLSEKQIRAIKNYESKGGKFRAKEDVKKMYVISPGLYASLEPFIQIPADSSKKQYAARKNEVEMVELNSADSIALDKLKGIGFAFAKRIIKYRDLLGGFIKKEQLLEVYGLDQAKYDLISENVAVDNSKVKRININTADFKALQQHPYIKYNFANLIVNYRKMHGNYKAVDDIKQLDLMTDELFAKISPYLTVQ